MKLGVQKKALLTVVAVTACALALCAPRAVSEPAAADTRPSVVSLRQERLATLREAQSIAERQYASGIGTFEQVGRVSRLEVDAELALATTPRQRADTLANAIKEAKKQEAFAQKRLAVGTATAVESLEAKAYRLQLEIRLAEEGAGEGPNR